jgi:hypothetical protein
VESWTTLDLSKYLPLHIFLGLVLLPLLALKLAGTTWRATRYYTGHRQYRLAGPPRLLLRLLAPLLVASTLSLFGSGVALIIRGHGRGWLQTVHAASFAIWGVLMIVHVVAYIRLSLRVGKEDWRRHARVAVAGARSRRAALAGALLAGAILALATYPAQRAFHSDGGEHRGSAANKLRSGYAEVVRTSRDRVTSRTHTYARSAYPRGHGHTASAESCVGTARV